MAGHADFYRSLVQFYPKEFRRDFADDLVQNFTDLLVRDGPSRAWQRTAVDLAVTVPRYRLETFMNPRNTNTTLYITTAVVALAAVTSITTGVFPVGGFILLFAAVGLAIASTSRLARSTRPADPQRRRHLLRGAAVLAATCVISTTVFWIELSNNGDWNGGKVVAYNAVFFTTLIGALACLVAGLRTPRTPRQPAAA